MPEEAHWVSGSYVNYVEGFFPAINKVHNRRALQDICSLGIENN